MILPDEAYQTLTTEVVCRALELQVAALPRGQYRVTGGRRPHYVDLRDPEYHRCDCSDHLWRDRLCKHIVAVLITEGDFRLWCRIRELQTGEV